MAEQGSEKRNVFQEGLYVGLGLALRTKEKIEDFGKKISEDYNMSEEEGKKFVDDLMKESEDTQTRLDELIEKRLATYMKEANMPTKKDIDKLSKKIDELEKKMNE
ncbi:MAG: phasin family protein [Spirochaetia bacterium]|nr:phasin family protein [Spirochaetia bacterium]